MKKITAVLLVCAPALHVFAQEDTTVKKSAPVNSYFAASLGFLSNSTYHGRKDSVATPYLTPSLGYYNKSGLFMDVSLSYLLRAGSNRVDMFNMEAGYAYSIGDFDGEVAASKPFYNSKSTNVSSQITGSLSASGGYDLTVIKPTITAAVNFGAQADYLLAFGLEHTFYLLKDKLQVTPGFLANGSTQNYYASYYNKRKVGGKRKKAGIVYDVTATVADASAFKVLDYEWSLPLIYIVHKFSFVLTPVYVVPVNAALVTVTLRPESGGNTITRTSVENISNTFYCSFGVSYQF